MTVEIRAARPGEVDGLRKIASATKAYLLFAGTPEFIVAVLDGRLVGMSGLVRHGESARIKNLFVVPEVRGKGVGSMLLQAQLAHLKRVGVKRVEAAATDMSLRIFLAAGFTKTRSYSTSTGVRLEMTP